MNGNKSSSCLELYSVLLLPHTTLLDKKSPLFAQQSMPGKRENVASQKKTKKKKKKYCQKRKMPSTMPTYQVLRTLYVIDTALVSNSDQV